MAGPRPERGALVYSTSGGRMCPQCRRALADCRCAAVAAPPAVDRRLAAVRVGRVSKGRGGKTVTLVRGLPLDAAALAETGKRLRTACGSGGTAKDGVIEVQGDHRDRVLDWLLAEGWAAAKTAGG